MLAPRFREIHLVDLDAVALERAVQRQPRAVRDKLILHAPIDLSGALGRLAAFRGRSPSDEEVARLPSESVESVVRALAGRFDVVLSACVLSQLMHGHAVALGQGNPQLPLLSCVLGLAHVRSLMRLLEPGGTAILITDMASSDTCPLPERADLAMLRALAEVLERERLCASGTGPAFLLRMAADDAQITPQLAARPEQVGPWLWHFSARLKYLVHALVLQRRS